MNISYIFAAILVLTTSAAAIEEGLADAGQKDSQFTLDRILRAESDRQAPARLRGLQGCDPADVNLTDYKQWVDETGYWVGDYSFFGPTADVYESESWPYRYDHYKGFITGAVSGNAYRQRNVFLYPPLSSNDTKKCLGNDAEVVVGNDTEAVVDKVGEGSCGENGNTKVFFADQNATTCSTNEELGGDIQGEFQGFFNTYTQLVGKENAVLYQVYVKPFILGNPEEILYQSQLTTITQGPDGQVYRTRSAQGFDSFGGTQTPSYLSFYRERKVTKETFYAELEATASEYNILDSDLCAWQDSSVGGVEGSPYADNPGMEACTQHLENTFDL